MEPSMESMKSEFRYLAEDVAGGKVVTLLAVSLRREGGRLIPTVHFYESETALGDTGPARELLHEIGAALRVAYLQPPPPPECECKEGEK